MAVITDPMHIDKGNPWPAPECVHELIPECDLQTNLSGWSIKAYTGFSLVFLDAMMDTDCECHAHLQGQP